MIYNYYIELIDIHSVFGGQSDNEKTALYIFGGYYAVGSCFFGYVLRNKKHGYCDGC